MVAPALPLPLPPTDLAPAAPPQPQVGSLDVPVPPGLGRPDLSRSRADSRISSYAPTEFEAELLGDEGAGDADSEQQEAVEAAEGEVGEQGGGEQEEGEEGRGEEPGGRAQEGQRRQGHRHVHFT